jgi:hypothetical protein
MVAEPEASRDLHGGAINTYVIGVGIGALFAVVGISCYQAEVYGENKIRQQWQAERAA